MKLMIVDDHAGVRDMIRQIAAAPGDVVCECATGGEAVEKLGDFGPDCVSMDLQMPGISGLEAVRAIIAARPATRVVIVSAYDQPELRRAAREAGAKGYVAKDDLDTLKAELRSPPKPACGNSAAFNDGAR